MKLVVSKTVLNALPLLLILLSICTCNILISSKKLNYTKGGKHAYNYNAWQKNGINKYFYIHNWKKRKRTNYKLHHYKLCSIFSIFKKQNDEKNANETTKKNVPLITNQTTIPKGNIQKGGINGKNNTGNIIKSETEKSKKIDINKNDENNKISHKIEEYPEIVLDLNKNPQDALKNIQKYTEHLKNVMDKMINLLNNIFFYKTKFIEKDKDFKKFFEYIFKEFEKNYKKITYINEIEKMHYENTKNEYYLANYKYFVKIANIIEEHLLHILKLKLQLLKLKALNDIKDIISKHTNNTEYVSFYNNINNIFVSFEKELNNLQPNKYIFTIYDNIKEKKSNMLINFNYDISIDKYQNVIKKIIDYLKKFSQDLTKKKKKKFYKDIEKNEHYENILRVIDNQQKQIEVLQEQLESSIDGSNGKYSPFYCSIAYRIPDTNLNISTQYLKKKFNIKLNCIPDDSMHLLGSYGFVKALPFGNLGLSFSLNF
ncbi:peripheral plastid protein 1, putative [Plasmodium berghei]|uniref:Peripheral plastid protein 1, putative n=2 Tax=Plasmodium berghei TaxID=5821 RepID=A0A509AGM8_PLABA|nr:peripheral plastid protein 1, putative [Plasmodium berghei ANKA]CXI17703.1 peripheral plastid protein 1, putative [Plasmodium berghei]SCM19718.1 peripheral plastid protein 1, putative [Plasmodium berghei]SCN23459.1 peripheral plastid protein 1, putative [Plasmodium berghei]SCO59093.1 peripheral plastid protein 1, putative [Plasmodium berghei]VUC54781.1 peripheral plastid protein 1, putative [Plasmodium berghei ANKA]|eukprot:XP_034420606.1 peripheral plastid protein 1, putative [Plasmodium berghei ANKA]